MNLFLSGDGLETFANDTGVTGVGEVLGGELGEGLTVESGLEVFEGEGVLEDDRVGGTGTFNLDGRRGGGETEDGEGDDGFHDAELI